jgi:8-oxo-dGTP diphosphatase
MTRVYQTRYTGCVNKVSHDSETAAHGQQVITACAVIHHDFGGVQKVFMPKRAAAKKFLPNIFEIPGGHIDYGEDIVAGLKREIFEEFGMTISVGDPFASFTYTNPIKGSHSIEVIYFAEFTDPLKNIQLHPDDHSEYQWIAETEIDQIVDNNKGVDDV